MNIQNNAISSSQIKNRETISYLENKVEKSKSLLSSDHDHNISVDNGNINSNIDKSIKEINENFQEKGLLLNYSEDEKTGKMVMKLVDSNTKEVIKQIPTKEMLTIADNIGKYLESYSKKGALSVAKAELINQKV